jgi:F0F1-type ATP synthase membrane subunit b/b'
MWSAFLMFAGAGGLLAHEGGERGPFDTLGPLKIVNTLIFAAILGYFLYKKAPAFFNARSADIQKAIREATGLKMDADLRYSAIDRKMATLSEEVKRLRDESAVEMEREHRRRQQEAEEGIRRIQANANAQIEAFRQAELHSLRAYATDAALDVAATRIRERAPAVLAEDSVREFVQLVERGKN